MTKYIVNENYSKETEYNTLWDLWHGKDHFTTGMTGNDKAEMVMLSGMTFDDPYSLTLLDREDLPEDMQQFLQQNPASLIKSKPFDAEVKANEVISDQQTFDDFWQVMSERGAIFEILMAADLTADDAAYGIGKSGDYDYSYNYTPPLEVMQDAQQKIIQSRGGIASMKEFLAFNADWSQYADELGNESVATEHAWQCDQCGKQLPDAKAADQHQKETGHTDMGFAMGLSGDTKWDKLSEGQGGTYGRSDFMLNPQHEDITTCVVCGRDIDSHSNPNTDYRGMRGDAPPTDHYFLGGDQGGSDDKYDFESFSKERYEDEAKPKYGCYKCEWTGKTEEERDEHGKLHNTYAKEVNGRDKKLGDYSPEDQEVLRSIWDQNPDVPEWNGNPDDQWGDWTEEIANYKKEHNEGGPGSGPTGKGYAPEPEQIARSGDPHYDPYKATPKQDRLQLDPELSRMTETNEDDEDRDAYEGGQGSGRKPLTSLPPEPWGDSPEDKDNWGGRYSKKDDDEWRERQGYEGIINILNEADFQEDEHPRADDGKFSSGGGNGGKHSDKSEKDLVKAIKGGSKEWKDWGRNEKTEELYAEIEKRNKDVPIPSSKYPKVFRDDPDAVSKMEQKIKVIEDQQAYWKKIIKFPSRDYKNHQQLGDAKWYEMSLTSTKLREAKKKLEGIKAQQERGTTLTRKPTYQGGRKNFYYSEEPKGESSAKEFKPELQGKKIRITGGDHAGEIAVVTGVEIFGDSVTVDLEGNRYYNVSEGQYEVLGESRAKEAFTAYDDYFENVDSDGWSWDCKICGKSMVRGGSYSLNHLEVNHNVDISQFESHEVVAKEGTGMPDEVFYTTYDTEDEVRALGATSPVIDEDSGKWYWNNYVWRVQHGDDATNLDGFGESHAKEDSSYYEKKYPVVTPVEDIVQFVLQNPEGVSNQEIQKHFYPYDATKPDYAETEIERALNGDSRVRQDFSYENKGWIPAGESYATESSVNCTKCQTRIWDKDVGYMNGTKEVKNDNGTVSVICGNCKNEVVSDGMGNIISGEARAKEVLVSWDVDGSTTQTNADAQFAALIPIFNGVMKASFRSTEDGSFAFAADFEKERDAKEWADNLQSMGDVGVKNISVESYSKEVIPSAKDYWEEEGWKEAEWQWGLKDYSTNWNELTKEQQDNVTNKFNAMVDEDPTIFEAVQPKENKYSLTDEADLGHSGVAIGQEDWGEQSQKCKTCGKVFDVADNERIINHVREHKEKLGYNYEPDFVIGDNESFAKEVDYDTAASWWNDLGNSDKKFVLDGYIFADLTGTEDGLDWDQLPTDVQDEVEDYFGEKIFSQYHGEAKAKEDAYGEFGLIGKWGKMTGEQQGELLDIDNVGWRSYSTLNPEEQKQVKSVLGESRAKEKEDWKPHRDVDYGRNKPVKLEDEESVDDPEDIAILDRLLNNEEEEQEKGEDEEEDIALIAQLLDPEADESYSKERGTDYTRTVDMWGTLGQQQRKDIIEMAGIETGELKVEFNEDVIQKYDLRDRMADTEHWTDIEERYYADQYYEDRISKMASGGFYEIEGALHTSITKRLGQIGESKKKAIENNIWQSDGIDLNCPVCGLDFNSGRDMGDHLIVEHAWEDSDFEQFEEGRAQENYEGSECNICGLDRDEHNESTGHEFTPAIIQEAKTKEWADFTNWWGRLSWDERNKLTDKYGNGMGAMLDYYNTQVKGVEAERKVSPNSLLRDTEPLALPTGKNALDQTYGTSEPETDDGQDLTGKSLRRKGSDD